MYYLEWSPALKVSSVCLSILSMLSSAKQKVSLNISKILYSRNLLQMIYNFLLPIKEVLNQLHGYLMMIKPNSELFYKLNIPSI